ncbi:hypothetical protein GQ43DRAFT_477705 [Delitschia confertaspora ATCC 74209]|uniref:Uncharacterized protein n=1 Tax=Delitschia confertaspora ATCC 74209 TaxID=1513339 RepID=A0A9P4JTS8_9PLEO|nr:hypothetical protein GQ43DRAFT_477705 [Delitschia confertaspora ATCC 74209]
MDFLGNIIQNSVNGFVDAGTKAVGGFAGDALIKAGDLIEQKGHAVGNNIEQAAASYGAKIAGEAVVKPPVSLPKPSLPSSKQPKALPAPKKSASGAKVASHSYTSPLTTSKTGGNVGRRPIAPGRTHTPVGMNKYPGGNLNAKPVSSAGSTTGRKTIGNAKAVAVKTAKKPLPKPFNNNIPYPTAKANPNVNPGALPRVVPRNVRTPFKPKNNQRDRNQTQNELPRPNAYAGAGSKVAVRPNQNPNAYSGGGSKTAVRPGQNTKPFSAPGADTSQPYPGTQTYPGQGNKTAVRPAQQSAYKPPATSAYKPPATSAYKPPATSAYKPPEKGKSKDNFLGKGSIRDSVAVGGASFF